jgi:DNA-directed RNA polymerase subunit RPC12/RpoP
MVVAQEFPEDWEYSGGELEKTLKVRVTCPYCKHKFEVEIGESWYNIGFSINCPKCGRSFPINMYGEIIGVVGPK